VNSRYFDYDRESRVPEFDVGEFLERSQEKETERLEEALERIESQLEQRNQIHQEVLSELESQLDWYLEKLEDTRLPGNWDEQERTRLKNRINTFYREIREEKQSHWKDQQRLEKERRQLLRELAELSDEDVHNLL